MKIAKTSNSRRGAPPRSELSAALARCRGAFVGIGLLSGMSNVLMLTGAMFMLEVYDRVLPSRSIPTLVGLSILAAGLFVSQGVIDLIRSRVLVRIGSSLDEALSVRVYSAIVRLPLKTAGRGDGLQPLRDLDTIRTFLSSLGPTALFDLVWVPLYLAICFAFHFWIGTAALIGAIILVVLTGLTEYVTREPTRLATTHAVTRNGLAESSRRNAEALIAMGMASRLAERWAEAHREYIDANRQATDRAGGFGAGSRVLRMMLQSGVLAIGAYLVIQGQASAGIIIAGSILSARALAPIDLAIANWKGFVSARQGWDRLGKLLAMLPAADAMMELPRPHRNLMVEAVSIAPPGGQKLIVQDASLKLDAGSAVGVLGPSGSGKSTLARALVGVWPPVRGRVKLDGAALDQWPSEALGRHVGFLPQDVELIAGSVADNIARFDSEADSENIIAAAKAAGVHDLIIGLPAGYETEVGEQGSALSAGQAQRVALARALYGNPFLVVLDEPNSNLDAEGDEALTRAILAVRARGGVVVVVAHRPSAIAGVDLVAIMNKGRIQAFGPKDEVLAKVLQREAPARALKVVPDASAAP